MAEFSVVKAEWCVPIPDGVDDIKAAAIANSGTSSWVALTDRGNFRPGQTVLINGATGSAGKLAIRIAKHLGAAKIIATGRNPQKLENLRYEGADILIPLEQSSAALAEDYDRQFREGVDIVLDYLGGSPAEQIIRAATRNRGSKEGEPSIKFVQIGAVAGGSINFDLNALRSSGLELLGSGLGAFSVATAIRCASELLSAVDAARLSLKTKVLPFAAVDKAWNDPSKSYKIVLTPEPSDH